MNLNDLGSVLREAWIKAASESKLYGIDHHPVKTWNEMTEGEKEVDRRAAYAVVKAYESWASWRETGVD